jgi:hypothetical protein
MALRGFAELQQSILADTQQNPGWRLGHIFGEYPGMRSNRSARRRSRVADGVLEESFWCMTNDVSPFRGRRLAVARSTSHINVEVIAESDWPLRR